MSHQITATSFRRGQTNLWFNLGSKWATSILWDQKYLLSLSFTERRNYKLGLMNYFVIYYPMLHIIYWRRRKADVRPHIWEALVRFNGGGPGDAWSDMLDELWYRAVERYEHHLSFVKIKPTKLNVNQWFTKALRRGSGRAQWLAKKWRASVLKRRLRFRTVRPVSAALRAQANLVTSHILPLHRRYFRRFERSRSKRILARRKHNEAR